MITKRFIFEQTDDRPDTMERGVVYVVGEEQPDMMMLVCPCGCDGVIYLGMHPQSQPCFRLEGLTIIPAIQRRWDVKVILQSAMVRSKIGNSLGRLYKTRI